MQTLPATSAIRERISLRSASSSPSRRSAFGYAADDRSAAYCRRRPRFKQTVAALCPRGTIASKFAITIHQSNLTKSLKTSRPQLFPRACTSSPPSESPPSLIGEKPRFSASAPISAGRRHRRYDASAAFAAIVAWAHQTSSSKADFVAASRVASMSSMGLFAPIGEVDMKSAPGPVRASRTDRRSDRSRP
jgi:hypothetical protein